VKADTYSAPISFNRHARLCQNRSLQTGGFRPIAAGREANKYVRGACWTTLANWLRCQKLE
jgi:hypothetical protein